LAVGRRLPKGVAPTDFIEADLLATEDFATLVKASGATHLLHLAWYAEHGKYWTSPLNLRWVETTMRLVEAFCEAGGQRAVIAGTCAEYDCSHGYCREDGTPLNPSTYYGTAKDAARRLVMAVCLQHQVQCAWGRLFLPYGVGEASQRLIPSLIDVFRGKRSPFGVNAPAYRDFLHASDVAEGFIALLKGGESGAYNISSGQPVQLADVVRELARLLDADPQAVLGLSTERPDEPLLLVGENFKLKTLGWQPALSLAQGLELTMREALP
jgi:nucleoside-diphosphate-sugar epimerase